MEIRQQLKHYQSRVDNHLENCLPSESIDPLLQESMRYSLFNGGKRVRPALVYLVNQILGGTDEAADNAAAAIECIHSYSLVHDDLPAMDDDDLRRGKPTCHIAYDEATAILAGDALQCLAFELLANDQQQSADSKIKLIQLLSQASGHGGMVVGQSFDLRHVGKPLTLEQLEAMHQHKTGALLLCAVHMGAACGPRVSKEQLDALTRYALAIGLAFQVQDDILDIEGDSETIGKPQGSDLELNKPTYPALLGLEGAKLKLTKLHHEAIEALTIFNENAEPLRALADFIVRRDH
ncbi:(2E,6E)-farnesyl diphosphate synthase [Neptuniibacter caesariensis]|uniref:Dimethylallyltransferase n=1 Tax=Neptuniibacter caesariensis TaxID=207954 RepID=A0A7U8GSG7_NEPCE|nr:farnesyl diphosphate synthase [Neptuniibacter caesariensis]EAR61391.1 dimethylallyltransferase [Oceanospirillum sp. MED92] [Neptuniibacter caesariensis]